MEALLFLFIAFLILWGLQIFAVIVIFFIAGDDSDIFSKKSDIFRRLIPFRYFLLAIKRFMANYKKLE